MYYNSMKQMHLNSLNSVMDRGLDIMGNNPSNELFNVWQDYAKSVLQTIADYTKDYSLMNDYLGFIITIFNFSPFDKFKLTIERLMQYYRFIGNLNY